MQGFPPNACGAVRMFAGIRKVLFWMHLVAGLAGGVIILVLSVTGVALAYEQQLLSWANRSYRAAPPAAGFQNLTVASLAQRAATYDPAATPANITLPRIPRRR